MGVLDVKYLLRTAIKGQILVDFVAEFTPISGQEMPNVPTCDKELIEDTSWWRSYVDGASNAKRAGTRVVIITPDGAFIEQSIRLDFKASNNEAEYETVLAGLNQAKALGVCGTYFYTDSLLVTSQINREYMARDERMATYLSKTQEVIAHFNKVKANRSDEI